MKAFVVFMVLCIAAFPFIENSYAVQKITSDSCCHKMTKSSLCCRAAKKQCNQAACQSMIGCNGTIFLKTEALTPAFLFPLGIEKTVAHHGMGSLSKYSSVSWRPPAV